MGKELTVGIIGDEGEETNIQSAIDDASDQDQITYLLESLEGKRIAAIVPAEVAEYYEQMIAGVLNTPFARPMTGEQSCPDGGKCHHMCRAGCWRVSCCGPLSGVFPGDTWPEDVRAAHNATDPEKRGT